jgi:hypothetical protein
MQGTWERQEHQLAGGTQGDQTDLVANPEGE